MLSDAIGQYLGSTVDGLAYSASTDEGNVFVDHQPQDPDRCVAVYSVPGTEADSKLPYDPEEFQIIVRQESGGTWAWVMLKAVYDLLHGLRNTDVVGVKVIFILATQASATPLGPDENGRPSWALNFRSEIYSPTTHRST